MKEAHRKLLSECSDNNVLENMLVAFLTAKDEKDRMTFEELMELCSDAAPLKINPGILRNIGVHYSRGTNGFILSNEKAFRVLAFAASKEDAYAVLTCGIYYYHGTIGVIDFDKAKDYLWRFCNNPQQLEKTQAYFMLGIINLSQGNRQTAKQFLAAVPNNSPDYSNANILITYLETPDNYLFCLGVTFFPKELNDSTFSLETISVEYKKCIMARAKMAAHFFLKVKNGEFKKLADENIQLILNYSLDCIYERTEQDETKKPPNEVKHHHQQSAELQFQDGWIKNIGDTLLDGYDKEFALAREPQWPEALKVTEKTTIYSAARTLLTQQRAQLEEAKEEGYKTKEINTLKENINVSEDAVYKLSCEKTEAEDALKKKKSEVLYAARRRELRREYYVQKHFFDPRRTLRKETRDIAGHLQTNRLSADPVCKPLDLASHPTPTRRLITAERSAIEASKDLLGLGNTNWEGRDQLAWKPKNAKDKKTWEVVKLGNSEVSYYQNPGSYPNHLGNYFIDIACTVTGNYTEILNFLCAFTKSRNEPNKPNEQALARLMLRYAKYGTPVTADDIKKFDVTYEDNWFHSLNQIFYHVFVKEVARRMAAAEDKYDLPVSLVQARAVRLIAEGHLSLIDVFSLNAPYGVVTGENVYKDHDNVIIKMNRINRLYVEKILKPKLSAHSPAFLAAHPAREVISSCKMLRQELQETYGGENDTDGEGYSSSEECYKETTKKLGI